MSTRPTPPVSRGDITLQPSYFTSSLFVNALRNDINVLVQKYNEACLQTLNSVESQQDAPPATQVPPQFRPFELFKQVWNTHGWSWLHFKIFDGRARVSFINVVLTLFSEHFTNDTEPVTAVVALFGLYTFFKSQPSTLVGYDLYDVKHIALATDRYRYLLRLPTLLTPANLSTFAPHVLYILSTLIDSQAFHILPPSNLNSSLPREHFVDDESDAVAESSVIGTSETLTKSSRKKGRPTKREKAKKAKDALGQLDKWLDKNTYRYPDAEDDTERLGDSGVQRTRETLTGGAVAGKTTHTLITHPPNASLAIYKIQKNQYLDSVTSTGPEYSTMNGNDGGEVASVSLPSGIRAPMRLHRVIDVDPEERGREEAALRRANEAVLARVKKIDEIAAEQGLEVGGEGGEMTGLERVERAVQDMRSGKSRAGLLDLLDGAGLDHSQVNERASRMCV